MVSIIRIPDVNIDSGLFSIINANRIHDKIYSRPHIRLRDRPLGVDNAAKLHVVTTLRYAGAFYLSAKNSAGS